MIYIGRVYVCLVLLSPLILPILLSCVQATGLLSLCTVCVLSVCQLPYWQIKFVETKQQ